MAGGGGGGGPPAAGGPGGPAEGAVVSSDPCNTISNHGNNISGCD